MKVLRIIVSAAAGCLLATSVFWVLHELIETNFEAGELVEATRIEYSRMRRDTEVVSRRDEKVEREPPPPTPVAPRLSLAAAGVERTVARLAPVVDVPGALSRLHLAAGSDRDVLPLVRIPPEYPPRALSRGIEGWVRVRFTITPTGTVANPTVVAADPEGVFEDAALKAISRWRYNPRIEGGEPVARVGVRTVLRFEIEDS
ncbi:MAG TPA: energy transducer TonB [Gammaproteobacteria bacterium]|nr:energy transducer TonB [Gammaproteobacteria bacterium]